MAICSTTILQEEVGDDYRGRVFSFYDMMFNVTYVLGAAVVACFMPVTGRSPVIIGVVAAGYAVTAGGYWLLSRHSVPDPPADPAAGPGQPVALGPAQQFLNGPVVAERAVLQPQLAAGTGVGLADQRPRRDPRISMISLPSRSGRIAASSSCSASSAIRSSRSS